MAGRPKKPTKELELKGAFKVHPERKRDEEPIPTGEIGDPPEHMKAEAQAVWHELVAQSPPGVLMNSDRLALEVHCSLVLKFRTVGTLNGAEYSQLRWGLSHMGMSPSDRSNIRVPRDDDDKNEFAGIGQRADGQGKQPARA